MCRKSICLVSFILVLCLAGYVLAAEADIEIPSVGYPKPILDGVMDDVWLLSTEQVMTSFTGEEPTSPEDCSASWWALWDEEYLYVLVNVSDEALIQDSDPSQGWLDDRVEIFIDGDNSKDDAPDGKNDYQYNFRWNFGQVETPVEWYFRATPHPSGSSLEGVEYGVATTDSGFLVEAKMPWSTLTGEAPYEDQLIGINIMIDDDDDGGAEDTQFQWFTETTTPHVPNLWGTAVLVPGAGEPWLYVSTPKPADGDMIEDTWANLSWKPGGRAVSHDVYIGDNFDDVNGGIESTFQGNQTGTFIVVGFPGFPYPDGLVPGITYYWRIDEVNDTEPNSPWVGPVWSFSIPPKTAYFPNPANDAESVPLDVQLSWTPGFGAKLHTVYFGETFEEVDNATDGLPQGTATYTPDTLKLAETYYWRVDEFDVIDTYKGHVWSFITDGAASSPDPAKGAVDITQMPILTWVPGVYADTFQVFFGADEASLELKGSGGTGSESFEPGQLEWNTTYYWRIDEANNANPDSPWTGPLWSFTTANFLIIDDMESYNDIEEGESGSNRIYNAWVDGYDDPTNGSQTGHLDPPFYEETIVHSGNKSMPIYYDNAVGKSEATLTLTDKRDWTVNGVNRLTIWYRGSSSNAAEQMYVALNGSAGVDHEDPAAAQAAGWNEWNVDLQAFADQGVNLTNVTSITLGLGNRANPVAGGNGILYFDDIRLCPPAP